MLDNDILFELRDSLLNRRSRILDMRRAFEETRQTLRSNSIESEENAQKASLYQSGEPLEAMELKEIRSIDAALQKIQYGKYGICESCGSPISVKRLKAIPWAAHCIDCASQREALESGGFIGKVQRPEREDLTDEDIEVMIRNAYNDEARLESANLEISCDRGIIHLSGSVPGKQQHQLMREILVDELGFDVDDIVDEVEDGEPLLYNSELTDPPDENRAGERMMMGEPGETDPDKAFSNDEPLVPPDQPVLKRGD